MMNASNSGRASKRLNSLDWIIIFVLILAVTGGIYYFTFMRQTSGEAVEISFTVELRGVKTGDAEGLIDMPRIGDNIYDSVRGYYLGVVTDIYTEPTTAFTWNQLEARFEEPEYPNECNLYVTVKAEGSENDSVITTGDVELRVGKEMYIKGKGYASPGYITDLRTAKKGA